VTKLETWRDRSGKWYARIYHNTHTDALTTETKHGYRIRKDAVAMARNNLESQIWPLPITILWH